MGAFLKKIAYPLIFIFFLFSETTLASGLLPVQIESVIRQSNIALEGLTIKAVEDNGQELFSFNSDKLTPIASTAKIVTTLAALETLGPAFSWETRFYADSYPQKGKIQTLYIRGGLDPHYVYEDLVKDALALSSMGIREIGNIVIDRSVFESGGGVPSDGQTARSYNQKADATLFNFNAVVLRIVPNENSKRALIVPEIDVSGLVLPKSVPLGKGPCQTWRSSIRSDFSDRAHPRFKGFFPSGCGERFITYSFGEENSLWAGALRATLPKFGIQFRGGVKAGVTPQKAHLLLTHTGKKLTEIVQLTNKFSNNVSARHIFLSLAHGSEKVSYRQSQKKLSAWLKTHGITSGISLENGSGLSKNTKATADVMIDVLSAGLASPYSYEWISSFPIASVDGTMKNRHSAAGRAHIKTGQLSDVRSIAGIVEGKNGRKILVFAAYQGKNAHEAIPVLDTILAVCASQKD